MFAEQAYVIEWRMVWKSSQNDAQWQTQEQRNHPFCSPHWWSKDSTGTTFS